MKIHNQYLQSPTIKFFNQNSSIEIVCVLLLRLPLLRRPARRRGVGLHALPPPHHCAGPQPRPPHPAPALRPAHGSAHGSTAHGRDAGDVGRAAGAVCRAARRRAAGLHQVVALFLSSLLFLSLAFFSFGSVDGKQRKSTEERKKERKEERKKLGWRLSLPNSTSKQKKE